MEPASLSPDRRATIVPGAMGRYSAWLLSSVFCALVLLVFAVEQELSGSDELMHWFVIPVALGGLVITVDAVRWLRGEVDVFDPIGIVGLFGVHFFLLAPLLHVAWNYWIEEVVPPSDWRPWLGGMAMLNLAGLLAYRAVRGHVVAGMARSGKAPTFWQLDPARFRMYVTGALVVAAALQVWVYAKFGGIWGYISAVQHEEHIFLGSERIATIAESFPILAMMAYAVYTWDRKKPSWPTLLAVLAGFTALKMLFGGLYGSRNNIIFAVFWGAGIIHFGIRPVPKKLVLGGVLALIPFLYLYGFYKSAGPEGLKRAFLSSQARADEAAAIHRPIQSTILADLGRSDVQAFLLYRMLQPQSDYEYGLGRTYVGAVLGILPGPIWRNRPPAKVKEGTEALFGRGSFRADVLHSVYNKDRYEGRTSRVFGIVGEAMLNFGPLSVPVAMAVFGLVVGWVHRWLVTWDARDVRRLLLPFLVNFCVMLLILDADNVIAMLEEDFVFPLVILALASTRLAWNVRPAVARAHLEGCP